GEGSNDLGIVRRAGGAGAGAVDRQPVGAGIGRAVGAHLDLGLQGGDVGLDLRLVDIGSAVSAGDLVADLADRLDDLVHLRIGGVDLAGAEAERVLHDRQRALVGAHGGGDRPVGGVVGSACDAEAGRDAGLGGFEVLVGGGEI